MISMAQKRQMSKRRKTEEATEMGAKYLQNKKMCFNNLKNIAHYHYNGFEEKKKIYIYIHIFTSKCHSQTTPS